LSGGALRLAPNAPPDISRLEALIGRSPELFLVWPAALQPFDPAQWRDVLDPKLGAYSYWIEAAGEIVGHAALRPGKAAGELRASFLYIQPDQRGRGSGHWLMRALEAEARRLDASVLGLTVRDYNTRALHLYTAAGFHERSRDGTAIDMVKALLPL
jgi:ribosomal protein S18 acetylase RimI-like enzyme